MEPKELSEGLMKIYDAAYDPDSWDTALDMLTKNTRSAGTIVYAMSPSEHIGFAVTRLCPKAQRFSEHMSEYDRRFRGQGDNEYDGAAVSLLHRSKPCVPILDTDMWSLEWMDQRPEVQFMKEKMNWYRQFVFNLSLDPLLFSGLLVKYDARINAIPEDDIRNATLLATHYAKALDLNRWTDSLRAKYQAVLSVLDHLDIGVALMDQSGVIILRNRHAEEIFSSQDGIWASLEGKLKSRDPDVGGAIQKAVQEVSSTALGQGSVEAVEISVPRRSGANPLLVIASPLRDAGMELERNLSGCLLTIVDTDRQSGLRTDAFAAAYGLTPTERRAAALLVTGLTTPEIGEELGVATSTAQTHVKSVFQKTGSSNRVNFVWKAVQFSPPII